MSILFKRPVRTGDLIDLWLTKKRGHVKESSWQHYRWVANERLRPQLGHVMAHKLDESAIQALILYWESNGNSGSGLSYATIRDALTVLRCILRFGEENNFACKPPKMRYTGRKTEQQLEMPCAESMNRLEEYLLQHMDRSTFGVLLCLYTGLRIGEICGLRWMDVDMGEGIMQINHSLQRIAYGNGKTRIVLGTPKSKSGRRWVPIPAWLLPLMKDFRRGLTGADYVISDIAGKPIEPRTYSYRFHKFLRAAGIKSMKFHMLRHFFATTGIGAGMDVKTLSETLGHADVQTTMRVYVHPTMDMKRSGIERIANYRHKQKEITSEKANGILKLSISRYLP